ncbi:MAG: hypothetical protein WCT03_02050 [Candidatus Obscuribacterales bacterium]|jgi:hypothetical protein
MNYKTTRFSETVAKSKKHICYGRPAAVYFSNEKGLVRLMALFLLQIGLLQITGILGMVKYSLYGEPEYINCQLTSTVPKEPAEPKTVEEYENVAPQLWTDFLWNDNYSEELYLFSETVTISHCLGGSGHILVNTFCDLLRVALAIGGLIVCLSALFVLDVSFRYSYNLPSKNKCLRKRPIESGSFSFLTFSRRAWRGWRRI